MRCVMKLSSLPKSLQPCPIDTLPCVGRLEISRGEVTLLLVLMTVVSTLPPCLGEPSGCGEGRKQPSLAGHSMEHSCPSWARAMARLTSMLPRAQLLVWVQGETVWRLDGTMFWGMHRCKGQMALYGALCFLLLLPTPLPMRHVLQFNKCWYALQPVSSVTSVLLTQSFVVSPVPDTTNTRALDHTFWCFYVFHFCFFIFFFLILAPLPEMASSHWSHFKALMVYFFTVPSPKLVVLCCLLLSADSISSHFLLANHSLLQLWLCCPPAPDLSHAQCVYKS